MLRGKNMSSDKYDENEFFIPRGTVETQYEVNGKKYPITVKIPDNFEHDKMMEEFSSIDEKTETVTVQSSELIEARLIRFLKVAPFKCNKVEWNKASDVQKTLAIRSLNPDHRTAINKIILGKSTLTEEDHDFLSKE